MTIDHPDDRHESLTTGETACGPFTLRWTERGPADGPLVLLLHGIYAGASGYEWRRLSPLLARHWRVRTPDLLGFGISDRPDLEYGPEEITAAVAALIADAGPDAVVVASSLTGAHAVRAVTNGATVGALVLITPTGLGGAQTEPSGVVGRVAYGLGRHTPLGDAVVWALSSGPSVRWFQTHQTYEDPATLTEAEVDETRRVARLPNAKHAQLAFVTNRLGIALAPAEVAAAAPLVIWGAGQRYVDDEAPGRWRDAGATVVERTSGLPQVEDPDDVVALIDEHVGSTTDRQPVAAPAARPARRPKKVPSPSEMPLT